MISFGLFDCLLPKLGGESIPSQSSLWNMFEGNSLRKLLEMKFKLEFLANMDIQRNFRGIHLQGESVLPENQMESLGGVGGGRRKERGKAIRSCAK